MTSACPRPFPLFPVAQANTSSQPVIELDQFVVTPAVAEVVQPANYIASQVANARTNIPPVASSGDLTHPLFEPHNDRIHPVQFAAIKPKAKEAAVPEGGGFALGAVHRQPKSAFDEPAYRDQHSFGRFLTADKDQEVVGVSHEAKAASFQLLIQVVQHNVGQ